MVEPGAVSACEANRSPRSPPAIRVNLALRARVSTVMSAIGICDPVRVKCGKQESTRRCRQSGEPYPASGRFAFGTRRSLDQ